MNLSSCHSETRGLATADKEPLDAGPAIIRLRSPVALSPMT
ncbi:MAG: hypothetical protein OEW82_05810 [Dehalococcoidia bacterium]|nr:hypothetical protein [Dehalococcoidia bacterium]